MYNKREFRKINDKKLMHKAGKQWVVMSAALLAMIGGGALAGHMTHAASVNAANNAGTHANTTQVLNAAQNNASGQQKGTNASTNVNANANVNTNTQATAQAPQAPQSAAPAVQNNVARQSANVQTNNSASAPKVSSAPVVHNNATAKKSVAPRQSASAPKINNSSAKTNTDANSDAQSVAPSLNTQSASGQKGNNTKASSNTKANVKSNAQAQVRNNVRGLNSAKANAIAKSGKGSINSKNSVVPKSSAVQSSGIRETKAQSSDVKKFNTASVKANATKGNIKITNGIPTVDGDQVVAAPNVELGGTSDGNSEVAATKNDQGANTKAVGNGNNDTKGNDPFEADPYNPVISLDFANVAQNYAPVGNSKSIQAHANDQLKISADGSVSINGKTVSAPKGYVTAPYTDSTYTTGTYTVLPRMYNKKDSTWSSENYTIGVQPESQASSAATTNVGESTVGASAVATPGAAFVGGPNNVVPNNTDNGGGNGGDGGNNNNNIAPNGDTVNNNDHDRGGYPYGYDDHNEAAFAALINNQDRDGQDALNRMQASGANAEQQMVSEANAQASNSAKAVSLAESGKDATTIQSMNNSSAAQSLKNEIAEQSNEQTLQNSYSNDLHNFMNDINGQRANLNSAGVNALDKLAGLTNLSGDQSNDIANQLQSAEGTYLSQLSHAQNPAQWNAVSNDYLASLNRIMSNAESENTSNRTNGSNSAANSINNAGSKINSLIDGNSHLTNSEKSALKAKFASEEANANSMASHNSTDESTINSIINSLNNDANNVASEGSSNATSNSNSAASASESTKNSENNDINSNRDAALNRVNQDPRLSPEEKAIDDAKINAQADSAIAKNGGTANSANTSNPTNANNAINGIANNNGLSNGTGIGITSNMSLPQAQAIGARDIDFADSNDKGFVLNNGMIADTQKPLMEAVLDRMANGGIMLVRQSSNIPSIVRDIAIVKGNMDRYSGNLQDNLINAAAGNIAEATTVPQAQGIAISDLNGDNASDKAYVYNNVALSQAQKAVMFQGLDGMVANGVEAVRSSETIPAVEQALAMTQNRMAQYSGNLSTYNNAFGNTTQYPNQFNSYDSNNGMSAYGTGLQHYDSKEYNNEANLVKQYDEAFGQGFTIDQLGNLNKEAFNDGANDAAHGVEAYPGIVKLEPFREGYNAYATGFHDGSKGISKANLSNYDPLYQSTYDSAYKSGTIYRLNGALAKTKAYKNGYRNSRAHRLAQSNVYGHSAEYVRGYIKGLNDRLSHHPDYIMLNKSTMLHSDPQFRKSNAITELYGGKRSHATELIVNGASVDGNGNVRYHVAAIGCAGGHHNIKRRINGWISADHDVTHDTYYRASGVKNHSNKVRIIRRCQVYSERDEWNHFSHVGHFHAGQTVRIRGIVHCGTITRFYVKPGVYFTANKRYVQWLK